MDGSVLLVYSEEAQVTAWVENKVRIHKMCCFVLIFMTLAVAAYV